MAARPPLMAVGRVARAHGIRGRILVAPFNEESEGLERVRTLWLARPGAEPAPHPVERAERVHLGYIFALQNLTDRDVAGALRGSEVSVARDELPKLDEDEVYTADLIGLSVRDTQGNPRGKIVDLEQAGPNELLVVRGPQGDALVPLAFFVELDGDVAVIEVPEGLFEVNQKPAKPEADEDRDGEGDPEDAAEADGEGDPVPPRS